MSEIEPGPPCEEIKTIIVLPEQIFDAREVEVMKRIDNEELDCPQCGALLGGSKIVDNIYQGVMLFCLECGFTEYG